MATTCFTLSTTCSTQSDRHKIIPSTIPSIILVGNCFCEQPLFQRTILVSLFTICYDHLDLPVAELRRVWSMSATDCITKSNVCI
ncbi:hypothetical protein BLOT_004164 [Blomia tropicalis]|nr:hypothetical protein BLOT_004164 [Blomia tropicalis]